MIIKKCYGNKSLSKLKEKSMKEDYKRLPIVAEISKGKELVWINPKWKPSEETELDIGMEEIEEAERRLQRFAPFICKCFPETQKEGGVIESEVVPIPKMQEYLEKTYETEVPGKLMLKKDSHLAVAGSIKARGGIYEVLKHTEDLAIAAGLITLQDNYEKLTDKQCRDFFSQYTIQVGSTGNLGLSIGITSAAIGYKVIVHMSADAKQWKKDMLKEHGVIVKEYETDYNEAVKRGRRLSDMDPKSYFVDDENSVNLFMGYAVAAKRLKQQLKEQNILVDQEHPLFVYLPCGVGGAPGGVTFGLKEIWGDCVHCFFVEPVQAPAMLLGMVTELHNDICVNEIGLSGLTDADGLAVGRPSGFVGKVMEPLLSGEFTLKDKWLYEYMRNLLDTENIFLEPSACAAFEGPIKLFAYEETKQYLKLHNLNDKMKNCTQIVWATGGKLVPEEMREEYKNTYL